MPIGEICNRTVAFATRRMSVPEMARLMRDYHVGDLVVVDVDGEKRVPVGIVTDRDLVLEVIAENIPIDSLVAEDIMSEPLVTVREDVGVIEAVRMMRARGVRRLPIVDSDDALLGIVTVDDLLELISEELAALSKAVQEEQSLEQRRRPHRSA